jgi:hypothetical protein
MTTRRFLFGSVLSVAGLLTVAACSSDDGSKGQPTGLQSSAKLQPDKSISGAWIYRSPTARFTQYHQVMIDPVVVYGGPEANFGDMSAADRQNYAQIVSAEFNRVIGEKYPIAHAPGPDVLRIHTTLIGVRTTVGGVATITRVMPIGLAINAVRGAAGEGGAMTGGIELGVEVHDSMSNELLAGAVRQVSPATFDLEATLSTADTVKVSAADAAKTLRDAMDRNMAKK